MLVILKPAGFTSAVTKFTTGGTVLTDVPYAGSGLYAGTGEVRIDGWKTAVGDLRGSGWVFGLGTNSFGQRHVDPTRPDIARSDYLGNLPLEIVYDAGVGGVAIAVAVGWVLVRKGRERHTVIACLCVYVVVSVFTSFFWFAATWLFAALSARAECGSLGTNWA